MSSLGFKGPLSNSSFCFPGRFFRQQFPLTDGPLHSSSLNELATCELLRASPEESVRLALRVLEMQPAHFDCLCRLALSYAIIPGPESEVSTQAGLFALF